MAPLLDYNNVPYHFINTVIRKLFDGTFSKSISNDINTCTCVFEITSKLFFLHQQEVHVERHITCLSEMFLYLRVCYALLFKFLYDCIRLEII